LKKKEGFSYLPYISAFFIDKTNLSESNIKHLFSLFDKIFDEKRKKFKKKIKMERTYYP